MQDIRRSLMIFHLKENFSQEDLQKAYKRLVKKYHPDFNQKNQDWSHQKMTEINLAYEQCKEELASRGAKPSPPPGRSAAAPPEENPFQPRKSSPSKAQPPSAPLYKAINRLTVRFCRATDRYYQYGLENRFLRYEGNRKIRFRQCLKELSEVERSLGSLEPLCENEHDWHVQGLYRNFVSYYIRYIRLDEGDIPRHPSINPHWYKMEDYLNTSLRDYLASHLVDRFGRVSWQVSFTNSLNHIHYLHRKYPRLSEEPAFSIIAKLAKGYAMIREEEEKSKIRFFFP